MISRNKFYQIPQSMRQHQMKKIHNEPMRSPSPDVSHRNGIKNTILNIDHVHKYLDNKHDRSRSPRIQNKSLSFQIQDNEPSEIQYLKQKIKMLQTRNSHLQTQKNSRINQEINEFRENLKSKQSSVRDFSPQPVARESSPQPIQSKTNMHDIRDKLIQMMEDNKRLLKKLQEKEEEYEDLRKQNEKSKRELFTLTQNKMEEMKQFYEDTYQPKLRQYEQEWVKKLKKLQNKIKEMEKHQTDVEKKFKTQYPSTPSKNNPQEQRKLSRFHQLYTQPSKRSPDDRLKRQNQQLSDHIQYIQNQLTIARRKCLQLQQSLAKTKTPSNDLFNLSKIEYLENQIHLKSQENQKLTELIEEQRIKSAEQINEYRKMLSSAMKRSSSQAQIEKVKEHYENQLQEKEKKIKRQLFNYLQTLKNIKKNIQESNIEGMLNEKELSYNDKLTIEKQLALIKEQNQRIITDLKKKLILQEQAIIQLEKENRHLTNEVNQLHMQKEKLKKSMLQFDEVKMVTTDFKGEMVPSQSKCKLKGCLKDTIFKIDNLQSKITKILNQ